MVRTTLWCMFIVVLQYIEFTYTVHSGTVEITALQICIQEFSFLVFQRLEYAAGGISLQ